MTVSADVRRVALFVALAVIVTARAASAQRFFSTGVSDKEVLGWFDRLQKAVAGNQRSVVAGMVEYPLRVNHGPKVHESIVGRTELLRQYDAVFTPPIRRAIVDQKPADLFANADGIAVGHGAVWLKSVCTRRAPISCHLGVHDINLPATP